MTVIIDAMGGAHAPDAACAAAATLSLERGNDLLLVGDEVRITATLARLHHNPELLMVRHAAAEEGQSAAAASAMLAARLLARGHGAAVVTAGDAQDMLRAADAHLQLIPGVPRPALCAVFPTVRLRGERRDPWTLILDVGAAHDASAEALVGFARMGAAYARRISRNPRPRVALLGSRASDTLGPAPVQEADALLRARADLEYVGPIGGLDIAQGTADVVVCNGYLGNVVIHLLEGIPALVRQLASAVEAHGIQKRLALRVLSEDIDHIQSVTDWRHYGGAPLLGYERPIILTQRDVEAPAFLNAIKLAAKAVREDIVGAIRGGAPLPAP